MEAKQPGYLRSSGRMPVCYYADVRSIAIIDVQGLNPPNKNADANAIAAASIKKYAFNAHRSAEIPVRRPLIDMRSTQCQASTYPPPSELPTVSVVFCFAEEMWSTLLRSVWSVLDRTPKECLVEIIMIDDASIEPWLQEDFVKYMAQMPAIVKVVKVPERLGLIRARTKGAELATGDLIVFLDSHIECSDGWYARVLRCEGCGRSSSRRNGRGFRWGRRGGAE